MTVARAILGRTFLHPALDYLLIGGGLALLVGIAAFLDPPRAATVVNNHILWIIALSNSAHFAASTVRLYTKPGAVQDHPLVSGVLPLVMLVLVVLGLVWLPVAGRALVLGYTLWSPYHYAGQGFGLGVIYAMRSGAALSPVQRALFKTACLAPSLYGVFMVLLAAGPPFTPNPVLERAADILLLPLQLVTFGVPVLLFLLSHAQGDRPLPVIMLTLVMVQGMWFFPSVEGVPVNAMATVFHGLQYLAVVLIFHVKDHADTPAIRSGAVFYAACVALGFLLFQCWPMTIKALGAGAVEAGMITVAVINIHHFIVDAYIWKVRRDGNTAVVLSGSA